VWEPCPNLIFIVIVIVIVIVILIILLHLIPLLKRKIRS
jgi:hypothetical protein